MLLNRSKNKCEYWGVFREKEHSPERETDDEAILIAVTEKLKNYQNCTIKIFSPHELLKSQKSLPDLIFFMCEEDEILQRLEQWSKKGVIMVNEPEGVKNTLRQKMVTTLSNMSYFPKSQLLHSHKIPDKDIHNIWVKRGDYHAVTEEDVQYAHDKEQLIGILKNFKKRCISPVVLQEHIPGDLIKFYGVRDTKNQKSYWFSWFYHKNQDLHSYPFDIDSLKQVCQCSADLLGVEVYGGDVIVSPSGQIYLIDLNAWPSFALYREEASEHIACYIVRKVSGVRY